MKNVLRMIAYPFVQLGKGTVFVLKYGALLLLVGVLKLFGRSIDIE